MANVDAMGRRRIPRHRRLLAAAKNQIDPRTLERALRDGPDVIHGDACRDRVRAALRELGVAEGETS